jgi:hypothetical protein
MTNLNQDANPPDGDISASARALRSELNRIAGSESSLFCVEKDPCSDRLRVLFRDGQGSPATIARHCIIPYPEKTMQALRECATSAGATVAWDAL